MSFEIYRYFYSDCCVNPNFMFYDIFKFPDLFMFQASTIVHISVLLPNSIDTNILLYKRCRTYISAINIAYYFISDYSVILYTSQQNQ